MFQPDLFANHAVAAGSDCSHKIVDLKTANKCARREAIGLTGNDEHIDLPTLLERLAGVSARPRYTFIVLNLIARAAGQSNSAGPYVSENGQAIPVRDWLSDAMLPMAQRDARRLAIVQQVRRDLDDGASLALNCEAADRIIAEKVRKRLLHSGRTNISRAVSDLVRAGMIHRHYQGYRVDHCNRGAQREAVYTIVPSVRRALGNVR